METPDEYLRALEGDLFGAPTDPNAVSLDWNTLLALLGSSTTPGYPAGVGTDFRDRGDGYDIDYAGNRTQFKGINSLIADPVGRARIGPEAFTPQAFQMVQSPVSAGQQADFQRYSQFVGGGGLEGIAVDAALQGVPLSRVQSYITRLASMGSPEDDPDAWEQIQANVAGLLGRSPDQVRSDWVEVSSSLPSFALDARSVGRTRGPSNPGIPEGFSLDSTTLQQHIEDAYGAAVAGAPLVAGMETGRYVQGPNGELFELAPSALMERFDSLGLPYPTERYGEGRFRDPEIDSLRAERDRALSDRERAAGQIEDLRRGRERPIESRPRRVDMSYMDAVKKGANPGPNAQQRNLLGLDYLRALMRTGGSPDERDSGYFRRSPSASPVDRLLQTASGIRQPAGSKVPTHAGSGWTPGARQSLTRQRTAANQDAWRRKLEAGRRAAAWYAPGGGGEREMLMSGDSGWRPGQPIHFRDARRLINMRKRTTPLQASTPLNDALKATMMGLAAGGAAPGY